MINNNNQSSDTDEAVKHDSVDSPSEYSKYDYEV